MYARRTLTTPPDTGVTRQSSESIEQRPALPLAELLRNQTGLQGRQVKTPQLWLNLKINKFPKAKTLQPSMMRGPNLISYSPDSCGYSFIGDHTLRL